EATYHDLILLSVLAAIRAPILNRSVLRISNHAYTNSGSTSPSRQTIPISSFYLNLMLGVEICRIALSRHLSALDHLTTARNRRLIENLDHPLLYSAFLGPVVELRAIDRSVSFLSSE